METVSLLRVLLSLLFVAGLIGLSALLLRRLAQKRGWGPAGARAGQRRLHVVERLALGPKHALLLVRRDDREHLLLMSGGDGLVVERDIAAKADHSHTERGA